MKILRLLLIALLAPIILLIGLLILLIALPFLLWHALYLAWFRIGYHGTTFFVYTRRHGWNEFVVNNVIPALE